MQVAVIKPFVLLLTSFFFLIKRRQEKRRRGTDFCSITLRDARQRHWIRGRLVCNALGHLASLWCRMGPKLGSTLEPW